MGNPKQKWTPEEEEALMAGIRKHGPGKWKLIINDPDFSPMLIYRSNVDLKDKWRNLPEHCQRDYITPQSQTPAINVTTPRPQTTRRSTSNANISSENSRYYSMIFEALSPSNSPHGSEFRAIAGFIEKKYEVPDNFRKLILTPELRKLLSQGKIERVGKRYIMKEVTLSTTQETPEQRVVGLPQVVQSRLTNSPETVEVKAKMAAYIIAESENKDLEAAKAVKEYERISQMAAEADAMLIFCQEVFEQL